MSGVIGHGGQGGISPFTIGSPGAPNFGAAGGAAVGYGCGGGGSAGITLTSGWPGGVGGAGLIIVTEYY
jgi:hypothetical protein